MSVEVKLFAVARQLAGSDTIRIELREGATVAELRAALAQQYPDLANVLRHVMFALDADYASDDTVISPTAEIACIPPVSGG